MSGARRSAGVVLVSPFCAECAQTQRIFSKLGVQSTECSSKSIFRLGHRFQPQNILQTVPLPDKARGRGPNGSVRAQRAPAPRRRPRPSPPGLGTDSDQSPSSEGPSQSLRRPSAARGANHLRESERLGDSRRGLTAETRRWPGNYSNRAVRAA